MDRSAPHRSPRSTPLPARPFAWGACICSLLLARAAVSQSAIDSKEVQGSQARGEASKAAAAEDAQQGGANAKPSSAPPHFEPIHSRWFAPGNAPPGLDLRDYEINEVGAPPWDPYHQNPIKGDFPIFGTEDLFFSVTASFKQFFEYRRLPTSSGSTGPGPVTEDFFGDPNQRAMVSQLALTFDLFEKPQAFEPVAWRLRISPVLHFSDVKVQEIGVLYADPSRGTHRSDGDFALQEAFFEYHLGDLSHRYDFISAEVGILPFRSDFRGFLFEDANLGARISGNWDANRWQYNLVAFDMLNKDTNSGLNEFEDRQQEVLIANVYRQDWPVEGYTSELSYHLNRDHRGTHFDDNGGLVSPAPVGLAGEHEVHAQYIGFAGEGHFGRWNVTNAFYHAFGKDTDNPFAAREVDIDANFAALEVSYDFDWFRVRVFGEFASGDDDPRDGDAEGFDAILDAPNFAGGSLSLFGGQALRLLGVNLVNAGSFLPDLQSSPTEGQSNFVNPGLLLLGGALDADLTPRWRGQIGASYLRFVSTDVLETYLELPEVEKEIGVDVFLGTQYRPLLTNNVILGLGASVLFPGDGLQRLYQTDEAFLSASLSALFSF